MGFYIIITGLLRPAFREIMRMVMSTLTLLLFIVSIFGALFASVLFIKILKKNPEEYSEASRLQGGLINVWKGKLEKPPVESGDFRIITGLKYDKKNDTYETQSGLSTEGLNAIFPY